MAAAKPFFPGYQPLPEELYPLPDTSHGTLPGINGHIHTPHSFSSFSDMEQPFIMAREEGISILGINDFNTTGGYGEFAGLAERYRVFPLFNIEFMALRKEEQQKGIRINDPVNPGRTYMSGKGLRYPASLSGNSAKKVEILQKESNRQTFMMVERLNSFLETTSLDLRFDAPAIQSELARSLLRERHIAMAVRQAIMRKFPGELEFREALTELFGGRPPRSPHTDPAALDNEIRNNLLKAGGPAYVPEDEKAFLSLGGVISLIHDAGGIPCYPVLLDDANGHFTDFEREWDLMSRTLASQSIYMVELIPGRNDASILADFVTFFDMKGFTVTFGTEHNTPRLDPLTVTCRGNTPLSRELLTINHRGAAVIAAHQYLIANGRDGFPANHFPSPAEKRKLEELGMRVIATFTRPAP